jgi:hypothetical protein
MLNYFWFGIRRPIEKKSRIQETEIISDLESNLNQFPFTESAEYTH